MVDMEKAKAAWEEITGQKVGGQEMPGAPEPEELADEPEPEEADEPEAPAPSPERAKRDKILSKALPAEVLERLAADDELDGSLTEWADQLQRRHASQERAYQERAELRRRAEEQEAEIRSLREQLADAGLTPEARKLREALGSDFDKLDEDLREKLSGLVQVDRRNGNGHAAPNGDPLSGMDPMRRDVLEREMARLGESFPDIREGVERFDLLDAVDSLARDPHLKRLAGDDTDGWVRSVFDEAALRVFGRRPAGSAPKEMPTVRKKKPSVAAGPNRTAPNRRAGGLTPDEQKRVIWNEMQKGKSIQQARRAAGLPPEPDARMYDARS